VRSLGASHSPAPYPDGVNVLRDLQLLIAVVVLIAGIAAALVIRGLVVRLLVLAAAVLIAAYLLGILPPLRI
jgi:hypothetical protein